MAERRDQLMNELFDSIHAIKRGMQGQMGSFAKDCPISRTQAELLVAVKQQQPVSFKQLAKTLYLSPGAVSQLADSLLQDGYLNRQADSADRRIQCLSLTQQGTLLLHDLDKRRRAMLEHIMHSLTDEELAIWLKLHRKIITQL